MNNQHCEYIGFNYAPPYNGNVQQNYSNVIDPFIQHNKEFNRTNRAFLQPQYPTFHNGTNYVHPLPQSTTTQTQYQTYNNGPNYVHSMPQPVTMQQTFGNFQQNFPNYTVACSRYNQAVYAASQFTLENFWTYPARNSRSSHSVSTPKEVNLPSTKPIPPTHEEISVEVTEIFRKEDECITKVSTNERCQKLNIIKSSQSFYFLIPLIEHKIRKWKKASKRRSREKTNDPELTIACVDKQKLTLECREIVDESQSKLLNESICLQECEQQQQESRQELNDVEEICRLLESLTLGTEIEKLEEDNREINVGVDEICLEITSISMLQSDIDAKISLLRRRKRRKAHPIYEPTNSFIVVTRIMAHKIIICQTIRGRQRGKRKKKQSNFLFLDDDEL